MEKNNWDIEQTREWFYKTFEFSDKTVETSACDTTEGVHMQTGENAIGLA